MSSFWDDFERTESIFGYFSSYRALFPLDVWKIGRHLGIEMMTQTEEIVSLEVVRQGQKMVIRYNDSDGVEKSRLHVAYGIAELLLNKGDFDKGFLIVDRESKSYAYALDMLMPEFIFRKVFLENPNPERSWLSKLFWKRDDDKGPIDHLAEEFGVTKKLAQIRFIQLYS